MEDETISGVATDRSRTGRRRKGVRALLTAGVLSTMAMVAASCVPSDFVKHTSGNPVIFSWFAPPSWRASHSTNGIDITNPNGSRYVGLAFAPIACGAGATQQQSASNFFNSMRTNVKNLTGFSNWRTINRTNARLMPAAEYGPGYWRQEMNFSGTAPNGTPMRGEGTLDVQFVGFHPGCYFRNQIRIAPSSQFADVISRLRATQSSISYFPPGVP